jgi:hypothetical protein
MFRIPAWLYILFGAIAIISGVLGVTNAPSGVPQIFWAVVTVVGLASLAAAWAVTRNTRPA